MAGVIKKRKGGKAGKRERGSGSSRSAFQVALVGILFLLVTYLPATWAWPTTGGADFTLHFFNVGQGDSSLVQCGRMQALVDGGPDRSVLQGLGRAMPFTDRRIEYVFLSHPHADHYFGLFAVLERYEVERLIMTKYATELEAGAELADLAFEHGVEVLFAETGDTMALGDCGEFEVLWPDGRSEDVAGNGRDRDNDLSLVLELRAAGQTFSQPLALFTGDINAEVETVLVVDGSISQTSILKVSHHGSRYSSVSGFIRAVRPEFAVIQVGQNSYGQPSQTVIHRLNKVDAQVFRMDTHGDIVFDLTGNMVRPLR